MRNYKKEYANYQGQPKQLKNRAKRNAARRKMVKARGAKAVANRDIDHIRGVSRGNGMKNLRIRSVHANRSRKK